MVCIHESLFSQRISLLTCLWAQKPVASPAWFALEIVCGCGRLLGQPVGGEHHIRLILFVVLYYSNSLPLFLSHGFFFISPLLLRHRAYFIVRWHESPLRIKHHMTLVADSDFWRTHHQPSICSRRDRVQRQHTVGDPKRME